MSDKKQHMILILFVISIVIILFGLRSYIVVDSSMYPTYKDGERIYTLNLFYFNKFIPTNTVIVLKNPKSDEENTLIKRIIAKENDKIIFDNNSLMVNNKKIATLNENFSKKITVKNNQIFVLGDNTSFSIDSRDFGTVYEKDIKGVVIFPIKIWSK